MKLAIGSEFLVDLDGSKTVLDSCLDAGVALNYSCKSGRCNTCRATLLSGKVENEQGEVISSGDFLSCCSKALSDLNLQCEAFDASLMPRPHTTPAKVDKFEWHGDVVSVTLRLPPNKLFEFLPGQYIDLVFKGVSRSYSLTHSSDHSKLMLDIKHFEGGVMSSLLVDQLAEGALMSLTGPRGTFFVRQASLELPRIIFIANGTGMAPIKAMVESLIDSGHRRPVSVYWGVRTQNDFYSELPTTWADRGADISFFPVLSRPDAGWQGLTGYVQNAVAQKHSQLEGTAIYACGSNKMIEDARNLFLSMGLKPERFYSDAFVQSGE